MSAPGLDTAEDRIQKANSELNRYHYSDAETAARNAIALAPASGPAYLLLARSLLGQLPNLELFPDTKNILSQVEKTILTAIELMPSSAEASCVWGMVRLKTALTLRDPRQKAERLNEAKSAFDRALTMNPRSFDAHYGLAAMVVHHAGHAIIDARDRSGVPFGQPRRIDDNRRRSLLQDRYGASIEDALRHTQQALEIEPASEQAMS